METKQLQHLQREYRSLWKDYGIENLTRGEIVLEPVELSSPPLLEKHQVLSKEVKTLEQVRKDLGKGCGCTLCPTRKNLVFGAGNPEAKLMFIGEGPGADEDEQGLPFVGHSGQLLTKIIEAMGFKREDVYIANVVKCRPPSNRAPTPEEVALCAPFLRQQIEAVKPQLIVALGTTAATTLVGAKGLATVRGKFENLIWNPAIPVMSTYHPAYLLRNPPAKKIVWEDMKLVMARMETK